MIDIETSMAFATFTFFTYTNVCNDAAAPSGHGPATQDPCSPSPLLHFGSSGEFVDAAF